MLVISRTVRAARCFLTRLILNFISDEKKPAAKSGASAAALLAAWKRRALSASNLDWLIPASILKACNQVIQGHAER